MEVYFHWPSHISGRWLHHVSSTLFTFLLGLWTCKLTIPAFFRAWNYSYCPVKSIFSYWTILDLSFCLLGDGITEIMGYISLHIFLPLRYNLSNVHLKFGDGIHRNRLFRRISGEFEHSWGTAEKLYKSEAPRRGDVAHPGIFLGGNLVQKIKKIDMAAIYDKCWCVLTMTITMTITLFYPL